MDESNLSSPCKECTGEGEVQLHAEVDHLRRHLGERDVHILALEAEYLKTTDKVNFLEDQLATWREKYDRVYDSHKRVQKLNQVLEEKLLQMVDRMKTEKSQLTKDIATLSVRLAESKHNYSMLHKENERYKNDMNLAIQLLQCKPDHFVSHKLDNLPVDTQARVSQYVMSKTKGSGSNHSKNGNELESFDASEYEFNISASLMSKILEDSIHDTVTKHCDTCTCSNTQTKPFCYDGTHYSIATQTYLSGEMKNSLCLTCNSDVKSQHSNLSFRSASPHAVKLVNDKEKAGPLYIMSVPSHDTQPQLKPEVLELKPEVPELKPEVLKLKPEVLENANMCDVVSNDVEDLAVRTEVPQIETKEVIPTVEEEMIPVRNNKQSVNMEPTVHHKLCDRTRTPISSKNSNSLVYDDVMKDKESMKPKINRSDNQNADIVVGRKNSLSSMGAASMSSSAAKSTSSTHKSNTQVGPGPRFCSLRMQAGSKNILLDNAQPDIPPILYRRQSKCNEVSIYKELNDNINNFIEMEKNIDIVENGFKNESVVVETTLIDVHVESNKEQSAVVKNTGINPVLMNVSSSPLQPLKTHNFSNSSEQNNNQAPVVANNNTQVDNLMNDFNAVVNPVVDDNRDAEGNVVTAKTDEQWPTDLQEIKIFNFDRYEQNKLSSQYKPLRKIDMSQLHSLENTKISKDFPPQGDLPKISVVKKDAPKITLPTVVNVYPNLTQTHLKVNDKKKAFTKEQSTSSLSSDDSATILQKQQLLRVAEWVEQNLEQQNNFNDPLTLEEDVPFNAKAARRESRISRLTATLNELALNMPHPVSKYSAYPREGHKSWVNPETHKSNQSTSNSITKVVNAAKETEFPVEVDTATSCEKKDDLTNMSMTASDFEKNLNDVLLNGDKQITAEDLARMEYNVKKFLLSGPQWANPESVRSRHTSSKTETDV